MDIKIVVILYLILDCLLLSSQTTTFKVIRQDQQTPLEFIHVFNSEKLIGGTTNREGIFSFKPSTIETNDTISFSFVGYTSVQYRINHKLNLDTIINIHMKQDGIMLNAVTITPELTDLTGPIAIEKCLKNISSNYKSLPEIYFGSYSEEYFISKKLVKSISSDFLFHAMKYPQKNIYRKAFRNFFKDSDRPIVKCCRIFRNPNYFKFYISPKEKCYLRNIKVSHFESEVEELMLGSQGGPIALIALDKVKYLTDFLDKDIMDSYDFNLDKIVDYKTARVYKIVIKPKNPLKVIPTLRNKKPQETIYSGNLYIDIESYAMVGYELEFVVDSNFGHDSNFKQYIRTSASTYNWDPYNFEPLSGHMPLPHKASVSAEYEKDEDGKWAINNITTTTELLLTQETKENIPADLKNVRKFTILKKVKENDPSFETEIKDRIGEDIQNFKN